MSKLRVSEHFYSIQGEGPTVGVPAVFVRLQGCNLNCGINNGQWVCDTLDVWKKGVAHDLINWQALVNNHYSNALSLGAHLVITGGEPLLQQDALIQWLSVFKTCPFIEVETNGSVMPKADLIPFVSQWNVSPKLSNSGEAVEDRLNFEVLNYFLDMDNAIFKFVIGSETDIHEIKRLGQSFDELPIRRKYLMPAADTKKNLELMYPDIIQWAKHHGFSLSQRFHLSIWDQTTGV